jgi:uncharacterized protein (UPF0332 family)
MKEASTRLLDKAMRAITAAERELASGDAEFAVARAYYAMLYVAEALLSEKGLRFRKHGGVHGAFGEHFAKTGALDAKYHRWLLAAFEKRITADYGIEATIGADDATEVISQAREFLDAARRYLERGAP